MSLSAECERQYALAGKSRVFLDFFKLLVRRYSDQGDEPLKLRVLRLGYGVLLNTTHGPRPDGSLDVAEYLACLVDRAALQELYIDNDLDVGCPLGIGRTTGQIAWPTFSPAFLPNLKRFSFTGISARSREWLLSQPDSAFFNDLTMGIGTERLAYSYVDDEGILQRANTNQVRNRIGILGGRLFFLRGFGNSLNLPVRSSTLLVLKPCHTAELITLAPCAWIRTLVICLQKQVSHDTRALRDLVAALPHTEHLWIRVGMDYPLASTRDTASHRGNAVRSSDGSLVDEQLHLYDTWREKWTATAGVVAASGKCPTEYLKIGHLAWRVVSPGRDGQPAVLEPVDRWSDEAEGPDAFQYHDPVRRDRPY